ncbi:MAG: prenyltransferase/squalene oxidase repeat-containing protein [Pirellulaceae bacterium]
MSYFTNHITTAMIWADPRFVYTIAIAGVLLLCLTIWLFRRPRRTGRQAGMICLMLSIMAHLALLLLVPILSQRDGGSTTIDEAADENFGMENVTFSTFDPDLFAADTSGTDDDSLVAPLPVSDLQELLDEPTVAAELTLPAESAPAETAMPQSLADTSDSMADDMSSDIDDLLNAAFKADEAAAESMLASETITPPEPAEEPTPEIVMPDLEEPKLATSEIEMPAEPEKTPLVTRVGDIDPTIVAKPVSTANAPSAFTPGDKANDFANRAGAAKDFAIQRTGGNLETEAAVSSALAYLVSQQQPDGSWDPMTTGAGQERSPLGESRGGAGSRATNAITGLSLLALLGSGNTHHEGEHHEAVYCGLAYLIQNQKADGSLAGNAAVYASTYAHGMAALAMCEAAAITKDPSAITSAKRAIDFTIRMQHPATGGWRYTPGDPGDMSQLGWQAMVLDAGHRGKLPIERHAISGVQQFIKSVRAGNHGGLASYRPGERPSRTMTAEALATRLLVGDRVPQIEVDEAERSILQELPGAGQDNYYYWYYATLALHQLQDDAWNTWNTALQRRLLSTQRTDGSWPTTSVWGGYGGSVYTTSMATLCLESYYRHTLRKNQDRVANAGNSLR